MRQSLKKRSLRKYNLKKSKGKTKKRNKRARKRRLRGGGEPLKKRGIGEEGLGSIFEGGFDPEILALIAEQLSIKDVERLTAVSKSAKKSMDLAPVKQVRTYNKYSFHKQFIEQNQERFMDSFTSFLIIFVLRHPEVIVELKLPEYNPGESYEDHSKAIDRFINSGLYVYIIVNILNPFRGITDYNYREVSDEQGETTTQDWAELPPDKEKVFAELFNKIESSETLDLSDSGPPVPTPGLSDLFCLNHIKLPRLTELNLNGNRITDVSPLSSLTSLRHLELRDNRITDRSQLVKLEEEGCTIHW